MCDEEITGFDENERVILDEYSGDPMDPQFRKLFGEWVDTTRHLNRVVRKLRELGVTMEDPIIDEDWYDWHYLTREQSEWSEKRYEEWYD
jgi:hypothetical protein